jgi:hypothetical protein
MSKADDLEIYELEKTISNLKEQLADLKAQHRQKLKWIEKKLELTMDGVSNRFLVMEVTDLITKIKKMK